MLEVVVIFKFKIMKDKFIDLCHLISNDNSEYDFYWEYLEKYENDPD